MEDGNYYTLEGNMNEKLTALCGLAIRQEGQMNALMSMVIELFADKQGTTFEVAAEKIERIVTEEKIKSSQNFNDIVRGFQQQANPEQ